MAIGNLGADAEMVSTNSYSVRKFRIGCSESYLDRNKQRQERTEWVSCVLWGKRGEALCQYLNKGTRVYVEGSLRTSSYEPKDGSGKRYKTEVVVSNVILLGGKRGERSESSGGGGGGYSDEDYGAKDDGDDVPF